MAKKKREWPQLDEPLPLPVTDNHTHLPVHDGEIPSPGGVKVTLDEQIARANEVRVTRMITSGCAVPDFDPTLALAHEWPEVKVALALHPNEAALHAGFFEDSPDGNSHVRESHHVPLVEALAEVSRRLKDPAVVAVGETGLDYYRTGEPGREAQKESFRAHLEMARAHNLPTQIHDREAHRDVVALLAESAHPDQTIVFHCFSGDEELAAVLAENGWYASFAGPLTYPANEGLRAAFRALPSEFVLVETDAPYLTPVPYRGCPNASYVMPHTVRYMAQLWDVSVEEAARRLEENTQRVYGTW